jgi:hypothetical protein
MTSQNENTNNTLNLALLGDDNSKNYVINYNILLLLLVITIPTVVTLIIKYLD